MVFAGLLVSVGILIITWIIVTAAECGLTLGMLLLYPFGDLIEKFFNKLDKRTEEEIQKEMEVYIRRSKNTIEIGETKEDILRRVCPYMFKEK